jgi:hypothetical protein
MFSRLLRPCFILACLSDKIHRSLQVQHKTYVCLRHLRDVKANVNLTRICGRRTARSRLCEKKTQTGYICHQTGLSDIPINFPLFILSTDCAGTQFRCWVAQSTKALVTQTTTPGGRSSYCSLFSITLHSLPNSGDNWFRSPSWFTRQTCHSYMETGKACAKTG